MTSTALDCLAQVCAYTGAIALLFAVLALLADYLQDQEETIRNRYEEGQ